jgi:hypothetical protein
MQLFLNKIPDKIGSCRGLGNTIHAILFFYRAAENHAACIGLNNTGYFYFNGFPNEAATVFYYDHSTVIQVRNTLMSEGNGKLTNIGGFVGIVESGCSLTVENCSFEGDIKFGTKGSQVGGFVGRAEGNVTLNGCQFGGSIDAVEAAGAMVGSQFSYATVTETDCTSTGEIKMQKES